MLFSENIGTNFLACQLMIFNQQPPKKLHRTNIYLITVSGPRPPEKNAIFFQNSLPKTDGVPCAAWKMKTEPLGNFRQNSIKTCTKDISPNKRVEERNFCQTKLMNWSYSKSEYICVKEILYSVQLCLHVAGLAAGH